MATWYTAPESGPELERLRNAWEDAPVEQGEVLDALLEVAREQVIANAPEPVTPAQRVARLLDTLDLGNKLGAVLAVLEITEATPEVTPRRYVLAQLMQAKNLWSAGTVSSDGSIGDGGYTFTPRPMDKTVRGIIRPADVKPHAL